jgi:hypothetical protein
MKRGLRLKVLEQNGFLAVGVSGGLVANAVLLRNATRNEKQSEA